MTTREIYFVERYALQTAVRSLLPGSRTASCLRWRIAAKDPVDVLHAPLTGSAHYGNLMVCGSVWHCPVCAAKIATRRVKELQQAIANWQGGIVMLTMTIQHHRGETCDFVLDGLLKAHGTFWQGRQAQGFKERYGIGGKIRSLEVTHGQNGWHAHLHSLLFLQAEGFLFLDNMRQHAAERWQNVLARHERYASLANGVDIRSANDFIAEYVIKFNKLPESRWTEAHELAHSHRKKGRVGGLTPNALLSDYAHGDEEAGRLWVEYAEAFKGKTHLKWSKGLRERLNLSEEKTDEELAMEQNETAILLARLDRQQWERVLKNDIRAEILQVAAAGNQADLKQYLEYFGIYEVEYPGLGGVKVSNPVMDVVMLL